MKYIWRNSLIEDSAIIYLEATRVVKDRVRQSPCGDCLDSILSLKLNPLSSKVIVIELGERKVLQKNIQSDFRNELRKLHVNPELFPENTEICLTKSKIRSSIVLW